MADGESIEVTPQMIEAGFAVLKKSGTADEYLEADKLTVEEIFRAMYQKRTEKSSQKA